MTQRFHKKPVEIEAMRLTEDTVDQVQFWLADGGQSSYAAFDGSGLVINTLEGDMIASPDDWVIKGIQGEFYPCKPDIFDATYEEV